MLIYRLVVCAHKRGIKSVFTFLFKNAAVVRETWSLLSLVSASPSPLQLFIPTAHSCLTSCE